MWWTESEPEWLDQGRSADREQPPWLVEDWRDLEATEKALINLERFAVRTVTPGTLPAIESLALLAAVDMAGLEHVCEPACLCGDFEDSGEWGASRVEIAPTLMHSVGLPSGLMVSHDPASQSAELDGWRCPACCELEQAFRSATQKQAAEHQRSLDELLESAEREHDQLRSLRDQTNQQKEALQLVRGELCREQVQRISAENACLALRSHTERIEASHAQQLRQLELQHTTLRQENLELRKALHSQETSTTDLHQQLQQERLQVAACKEEMKGLAGELKEECERRNEAMAEAAAAAAKLRRSRQQAAQAFKRLRGEAERQRNEFANAKQMHQRETKKLLRTIEDSYRQLAIDRSRVQQLESQLKAASSSIECKDQLLAAAQATAQADVRSLQQCIEQQAVQTEGLRRERDANLAQNNYLQAELEQLRMDCKQLDLEGNQLRMELAAGKAQLTNRSSHLLALQCVHRQRGWQLRQTRRKLQAQETQISELQQGLSQSESELDGLRVVLSDVLSTTWQASNQQALDRDRMRAALERRERGRREYGRAFEELRQRLQDSRRQQQALQQEVRERSAEIRKQRDVNSVLEAELNQCRRQIDQMRVAITAKQSEQRRLELQLASTDQQLQQLTQKSEELERQSVASVEQLTCERDRQISLLQQSEQQNLQLERQLQELSQELTSLQRIRDRDRDVIHRQLAEGSNRVREIVAQKTKLEQCLAEAQATSQEQQQVLQSKCEQLRLVCRLLRRRCQRAESEASRWEGQAAELEAGMVRAQKRSRSSQSELSAATQGMREMQLLTQDVVQRLEYERFSNHQSRQRILELTRELQAARALQSSEVGRAQDVAAKLQIVERELQDASAVREQLEQQCRQLQEDAKMLRVGLKRRIDTLTLESFRRSQQRWQLSREVQRLEEELRESRRIQADLAHSEQDLKQACGQFEQQLERLHAMLRNESAGRRKAEVALERAADTMDETSRGYFEKIQMELERGITRTRNELIATQGLLKKERNRLGNLRVENDLLRQEVQGLRYRQAS